MFKPLSVSRLRVRDKGVNSKIRPRFPTSKLGHLGRGDHRFAATERRYFMGLPTRRVNGFTRTQHVRGVSRGDVMLLASSQFIMARLGRSYFARATQ